MKKSKKNILLGALLVISASSISSYILSSSTIADSETISKQKKLQSPLMVNSENNLEEKNITNKARFDGTQLDKNAVNSLGWHSKTEITLEDWKQAPNVTEIGTGAISSAPFLANIKLWNIEIPARIKVINNSSFQQTLSLRTVTFEKNSQLTKIEHSVFNRSGINGINIPSTLTSIGNNAFGNCSNLRTVTFAPNSQLKIIWPEAFSSSGIVAIELPDSLQEIRANAFRGTDSLKGEQIRIPARFRTETVSYGFTPAQWNSIDWKVEQFTGTILTQETVKSLNWTNKTTITLEDWTRDAPKVTKIGNGNEATSKGAFYNNSKLETIEIPNAIRSIGNFAFEGASKLKTVTFNEASTLTSLGTSVFQSSKIETITIPKGVTTIPNFAFASSGLISINIPDSITKIGDNAFSQTNALLGNKVSMLIKLKSSSVQALYGFKKEQWDTISWRITPFKGVALTKESAISLGWDTVTTITQQDWIKYAPNVTKVGTESDTNGNGVFSNNKVLTTIEIPEKVTFIGNYVFENSIITSIYVPDQVTTIGTNAFSGTTALKGNQVSMSGALQAGSPNPLYGFDATQWASIAWRINKFEGDTLTKEVVVSLGWNIERSITLNKWQQLAPNVTKIGTNTGAVSDGPFANNTILETIEIPNSITFISNNAFTNASALKNVQLSYLLINPNNTPVPQFGFNSSQWEAINWIQIPAGNVTINSIIARDLLKVDSIITWEEISSYTGIQAEAFKGTNITAITIKNKAGFTIGNNAFVETNNLTNIEFSENFKDTISNYGFSQSQIDNIKYIGSTLIGGDVVGGSNTGAIVGSISGIILVAAAAAGGFYLFKYLREKRQELVYETNTYNETYDESSYYDYDESMDNYDSEDEYDYYDSEDEYYDSEEDYYDFEEDYYDSEDEYYEDEYDYYDSEEEYIEDDDYEYEEEYFEDYDDEEEYFEDYDDEELEYGDENYYENDDHEYDDENQFVDDNYLEDESFEDYEEEYDEEDYWDDYE